MISIDPKLQETVWGRVTAAQSPETRPLPLPSLEKPGTLPAPIPDFQIPDNKPMPLPDFQTPDNKPMPLPDFQIPDNKPMPLPDFQIPDNKPMPLPDFQIPDNKPMPLPDFQTPDNTPMPIPERPTPTPEFPTPEVPIVEPDPLPIPDGSTPLTPEELISMMHDTKNDAAIYRYLAKCAGGADAKTLLRIASDELRHFKKLSTMYFLITGSCVRLSPIRPVCTSCLVDVLRAQYLEKRKETEMYDAAGARWTEMAEEFFCMARDAELHSRLLKSIICNRI